MKKNQQKIDKPYYDSSGMIELHHCFMTIQGEGPFAGVPAVFVRLYGCNLRCPFCDTDYTSENHKVRHAYVLERVKELTKNNGCTLVVISGGEPFRQNIGPMVRELARVGYHVQIETNGTVFPSDFPARSDNVTIVCSPKTGTINKNLVPYIDALKYVVHADQIDPIDGLPLLALGHSARPTTAKPPEEFDGDIYVQPIDVEDPLENARHLDAAIRSCMKHGYTLCVQIHKMIDME